MAEVFATKEALKYSENIISQFLRDSGYDGSLEDGTGIYDAVIRPNSLLYTMYRQDLDKLYAYMSLSKANELKSTLSKDDYDAAIDGILSNWFVTRNDGIPAYGVVRMWFSTPPDFIVYSAGDKVGSYEDVSLIVRDTVAFSSSEDFSDYHSVVNTTDNTVEYYVDLSVVADSPTDIAIPKDSTITSYSTHIYFLRATIPSDFVTGTARESSEAFIARSMEAITTRELITDRAIKTVLLDEFPEIHRLYVAGHGDPEMIRDIKTFAYSSPDGNGGFLTSPEVSVHVGNMADIWVASGLVKTEETCTPDTDGNITIKNTPSHILSITSDDTKEELEYEMSVVDSEWLIPGVHPVTLRVKNMPALDEDSLGTVTVSEITSTVPYAVQEFLYNDSNRVSAYDPKVKMMHPLVMDFYLTVCATGVSATSTDEEKQVVTDKIKAAVLAYIEYIAVKGSTWIQSEMIRNIHNSVPEVVSVNVPITMAAKVFDSATSQVISMFTINGITLPAYCSKQLTENTIQSYTHPDMIHITYV